MPYNNDYYNQYQNNYGNGSGPYPNNDYQNAYNQGYGNQHPYTNNNQNYNPYGYNQDYNNQGYYQNGFAGNAPAPKSNTSKVAIIASAATVIVAIIAIVSVILIHNHYQKPENYTSNQLEALILADMDKRLTDTAPDFAHDLLDLVDIECDKMIYRDGRYVVPCTVHSPYLYDWLLNYGYLYPGNNEYIEEYITETIDNSTKYDTNVEVYYNPETKSFDYPDDFLNAVSGYSWDIIREYIDDYINTDEDGGIDIDDFTPPERSKDDNDKKDNKDEKSNSDNNDSSDNESTDADDIDTADDSESEDTVNDEDAENENDISLYSNELDRLESEYGKASTKTVDGVERVTGLCYAKLVDMDDDDNDELICAYLQDSCYIIEVFYIEDGEVKSAGVTQAYNPSSENAAVILADTSAGVAVCSGGNYGDDTIHTSYNCFDRSNKLYVYDENDEEASGSKTALSADNLSSLKSDISSVRSSL